MAANETFIREKIDSDESGFITLDMLRSALDATKPELIENAAGEFRSAMTNLKTLIDCLDRHLDSFDKKWTAGEDAKMVKTQFRRLRESAQNMVDAIVGPNPPGVMGLTFHGCRSGSGDVQLHPEGVQGRQRAAERGPGRLLPRRGRSGRSGRRRRRRCGRRRTRSRHRSRRRHDRRGRHDAVHGRPFPEHDRRSRKRIRT